MAGGKARPEPRREAPGGQGESRGAPLSPQTPSPEETRRPFGADLRHRAPTAGGGRRAVPPPSHHAPLHADITPTTTHTCSGDPSYCARGLFDRLQPDRGPRRAALHNLRGRLPQRRHPSPAALPSGGREAPARGGVSGGLPAPGAAAILVLGSVRGGNGTAPSAGTRSPPPKPRSRPAEPSLLPFPSPGRYRSQPAALAALSLAGRRCSSLPARPGPPQA